MDVRLLFFIGLLCACASPQLDGSHRLSPDDMAVQTGGTDGDGAIFGSDGALAEDGEPETGGPNDAGGLNLPPGADLGLDGTGTEPDAEPGNGIDDGGSFGGGRGDTCLEGAPESLDLGFGVPFQSLLDGEVMPIFLGTDGGANVRFSLRFDQYNADLYSRVELVDSNTEEIIGALNPIGLPQCMDEQWEISGVLLSISPAIDPFALIGQPATIRVGFYDDEQMVVSVAEHVVSVFLELATD